MWLHENIYSTNSLILKRTMFGDNTSIAEMVSSDDAYDAEYMKADVQLPWIHDDVSKLCKND